MTELKLNTEYTYTMDGPSQPDYPTGIQFTFKITQIDIKSKIMSKDEINQLAEIFNNGITFWHVDNGAEIGEYHVENVEV